MQTHQTNDTFWLDFQNRLKASHPTVLDQTSNLNKLIDDTIQDYHSNQNIDRTLNLIKQLQDVVESIFDKLSQNLTTEEVDALTNVCRRFNEDDIIWEIRDSHTEERLKHEPINVLRTSGTKDKMSSFVESNFPFGPTRRAFSESVSPGILNISVDSPQQNRRVHQSAPAEPQAVVEENKAPEQITNKQDNEDYQKVQIEELKPEVPPQINEEVKSEIDSLIKTMIDELAEHKIDNVKSIISLSSKIPKAHDALLKLREIPKSKNFNQLEAGYYQAKRVEHERLFEDIDNLFNDCEQIVRELEDENGYIVEGVKKNFTIKYKQAAGQNISLKMEGIVDVPIFNMIALLYEMEGYSLWMPFCKEGRETKDLGRASKAAYIKFNIPPPVFDREGYVYGNGFDRIQKNGSLLVSARSCHNDEKLCKRYDIPVPATSKTTRMDLEYMGGAFSPIGSDKMKINLVCKVDLKIKFVPLGLINWIVRKAAQFLIDRLVKKATNFKGTLWEKKIQQNREFYGWLESKINAYVLDEATDQQQKSTLTK